MFKNYFKIAFRNLIRQKGYSLINIIGLAIGIGCTILLTLWIVDELSFDNFHVNGDRIFRVLEHQEYTSSSMEVAVTPGPLAAAMKEKFPEIEYAVRFNQYSSQQLKNETETFPGFMGLHADPDFLKMFTFPVLQGNPEPLSEINSIVLTASAAEKIFGSENSIGKTLMLGSDTKVVSAVIEDVPPNSQLRFDYILPIDNLLKTDTSLGEWGNNSIYTYIQTYKGVDIADLNAKIKNFIKENNEGASSDLYLQSLLKVHLHSSGFVADFSGMGDFRYIIIFGCISLFILIISSVNFISLTTARYTKRAREVGMRKVLGSTRKHLIFQFLGESYLMVLLALIAALVLVELVLPLFNQFVSKQLSLSSYSNAASILLLLGMTLLLGFLAGIYPAFLLSSFKPVTVLKGSSLGSQKGGNFRKILVVLQWSLSIILIISTVILFNQLQYMQNKKLGFDKEQILYTRFYDDASYETIKEELLKHSGVESVTSVLSLPHSISSSTSGGEWSGKAEDETFLTHFDNVAKGFIETFHMEMAEGNTFLQEDLKSDEFGYILNETAIAKMGLTDPVGSKFSVWGMDGKIVGVVKDFHFKSLHNPIEPLMLLSIPGYLENIVVRVNNTNVSATKAYLEETVQKFAPDKKIEFKFFDDRFAAMYKAEQEMSTILKFFTGLAIFIACLGLFGLSAYLTEQRTREIGIRKVLGAEIPNIIITLSQDFTKWIIIANLIAIPVAWYIMQKLLQNFAYHIKIDPIVFLLTFIVSLLLAVLTIISQTIKAALANPVKALKYE
ncbi:MAG: ABC transporter permease [Candidatus Cloacimonadales bacterium]|nr:ABC transporter permease [Candidatus Cloacimonadales bacterium]